MNELIKAAGLVDLIVAAVRDYNTPIDREELDRLLYDLTEALNKHANKIMYRQE